MINGMIIDPKDNVAVAIEQIKERRSHYIFEF